MEAKRDNLLLPAHVVSNNFPPKIADIGKIQACDTLLHLIDKVIASMDYSIYYSRFHDDTEAHAELMAGRMKALLESSVPADRTVPILDVGCGYGFALRALRHMGFTNVKGLELSPQQAERCRKAGLDVVVTEDTIQWLKDNAGQFAFIVLFDVLEHVPVPVQIEFARAVHEALRPGGQVLITVPNANAMLFGRWRYNDYTHHSSFTEHSLYFVLKNAGFQDVTMDATKGVERFPLTLWKGSSRQLARRRIVRWCWLQVFKAEIPWEKLNEISFELNLKALATKAK